MYPVNKIPYKGPKSFLAIIEKIAEEAQAKGKTHIDSTMVNAVIQQLFSKQNVFRGILFFSTVKLPYIGHFLPNPEYRALKDKRDRQMFAILDEVKQKEKELKVLQRQALTKYNAYMRIKRNPKLSQITFNKAFGYEKPIKDAKQRIITLRSKANRTQDEYRKKRTAIRK